jgi:hypothetical protein
MRCLIGNRRSIPGICALVVMLLAPGAVRAQANKALDKGKAEPGYRPSGKPMDPAALSRFIDSAIDQRLKAEQVEASPLADDAEFIRRVTLDLTGQIPTPEKVIGFLESKDPQKRAKLIDSLLASEVFGKHQADIWQALLLPPRNSDNRQLNTAPLVKWLEESFNANKPWDKMTTELLTASGEQDKNGATTYFIALNSVDKITDNVSRVFLGVHLQCAQCHNHPFTEWKQTEYWGMAAFFLNVQATRPQQAARQGTPLEVKEVAGGRRGRGQLPDSAKIVPPKYLGAEQPRVRAGEPLRPVLTSWLTKKDNPYFARAMVNRTWAQLFGRGLVNPVDDIQDNNPPLYPELLGELSYQFAENGFDLKYLTRAICNSTAYQRTSKPVGNNRDASPALLSHMTLKVMTPEQLYDSLTQVVGPLGGGGGGGRFGMGAMGRGQGGGGRAQFVAFFGNEDGTDPTEYQAGIPQALRLMNGPGMNNPARIAEVVKAGKTPEGVIERLYLMTLSRKPTAREMERFTAYVKGQSTPNKAYADLLWALVNSSEFVVNH